MKKVSKLYIVTLVICSLLFIFLSFKKLPAPSILDNGKGVEETTLIGNVEKELVITQKVLSRVSKLDRLAVSYANFASEITSGIMDVKIYNPKKEMIYYNSYDMTLLEDNSNIIFEFDIQNDSYGKEYTLEIDISDMAKGEKITFLAGNDYENIKFDRKVDIGSSLKVYQYGNVATYIYTYISFVILLLVIMYGSWKYLTYKEISKWYYKAIDIFIYFTLSIILGCCIIDMHEDILRLDNPGWVSYLVFIISSIAIVIKIGYQLKNSIKKPEKLFLMLAIPLGSIFLCCNVPGNTPDEPFHYRMLYKTYSLKWFSDDFQYPAESWDNYFLGYNTIRERIFNNNEIISMTDFERGSYSIFMYLIGTLGLIIGNLFGVSIIMTMYLSSFMNLILLCLAGYYSIKKIPFAKYALLVYLLSPMNLQQMTSMSADAMINMFSILFIVQVLNIKFTEKDISLKNGVILSILLFFVLMFKNAYFPLAFLLIILKNNLKNSKKRNKKRLIFILLLPFIIYFIITFMIPKFINNGNAIKLDTTIIVNGVKAPQQLYTKFGYFINNLITIPMVIINTLLYKTDFYITSFAGQSLGWFNINMPIYLTIMYYVLLFYSVYFEKEKNVLKKWEKWLFIIIWGLNFAVICGGLFLGWGNIREFIVEGVQGRYFIPINFLLLCTMVNNKVRLDFENKKLYLALGILFINLYSIMSVINWYL